MWKNSIFTIRIFDERQSFHSSIVWTFNEFNAKLFKSFTRHIYIRYHNANMTEAPGFCIPIVILRVGVGFGSPITEMYRFGYSLVISI